MPDAMGSRSRQQALNRGIQGLLRITDAENLA
jgi:hypothetical protein